MNEHITQIHIRNFQSHRDTLIRLKPGVNAIVGLSDAGKSAVLRATGLVLANSGLDQSRWGGVTDVEVTFADGNVVSRTADPKNKYYLLNDDVDNVYENVVKDGMPTDIAEVINMDEINISRQMDLPFLLGETAGQVAKTLNKCCNLEIIDTTIKAIKGTASRNKDDINVATAQLSELEEQKASFAFLKQMEEDVNEYELLVQSSDRLERDMLSLDSLLLLLGTQKEEERELSTLLQSEADINEAFAKIETQKVLSQEIFSLTGIIAAIERDLSELQALNSLLEAEMQLNEALSLLEEVEPLNSAISGLNQLLMAIEGDEDDAAQIMDLLQAEPLVNDALKLIEQREVIQKEGQGLLNLITAIEKQQKQKASLEEQITDREIEFNKAMPDTCPLCGERP